MARRRDDGKSEATARSLCSLAIDLLPESDSVTRLIMGQRWRLLAESHRNV